MMISKVITITLITILCVADNRMILPKHASKQELPAQRFNRHDFPISFKYDEGYQYSISSPMLQSQSLVPNIYQRIQYAPLHEQIYLKNKNTAAEYTKITPTLSSASASAAPTESFLYTRGKNLYSKSHLEPRMPASQVASEAMKCYSPGHKIEVLSAVSRSPGHNAMYRKLPDPIQGDKSFKINNNKPYGYRHMEGLTTMLPFPLPPGDRAMPFSVTNQRYVLNPNAAEQAGSGVEKIKRQYSPSGKLHRLHLKIARVYSPGQVPPKSPAFADTYSLNFGRLSVHSQAYIPPVYRALPIQKTVLYPVKDNKKSYRFRML